MAIYNNVLDTIGNTPIIRINSLAPDGVELYVKAESFNPGGSVKDRLALGVPLSVAAPLHQGPVYVSCWCFQCVCCGRGWRR